MLNNVYMSKRDGEDGLRWAVWEIKWEIFFWDRDNNWEKLHLMVWMCVILSSGRRMFLKRPWGTLRFQVAMNSQIANECKTPTMHLRSTVKLVYKDYPRDQQNVVPIHRWSLYAGSIAWKIYTWGPVKCGLYKQVVFVCRWSLEQVWLYVYLEN